MTSGTHCQPTRRDLFCGVAAIGALARAPQALAITATALPIEVAGIAIPHSPIGLRAAALSRTACPDFLFNHCMRTFLFGALFAKKRQVAFNADEAFVGAALHDLGLLPAYASASASFELDGADRAERFAKEAGLDTAGADVIWHSIAFHDGQWPVTKRAGPEAIVVSAGAGADVDGPDTSSAHPSQIAEVLAAFPRLQFKRRFTALLVDHCKRKPQAQAGTWLEGLCREQAPAAWKTTVEQEIASSGYAE